MSRRLADALTALAARTFPPSRAADARAVRDCAREAIDASGLGRLPLELLSLAAAGLRMRAGLAARDLRAAPWRAAFAQLTFPLATAILCVWVYGFVPRYDHWPLGEGWMLLLGGSLAAMIGAALRSRLLTAAGALATFVAAVSPHFGYGTEASVTGTPSFFEGLHVDIAAASLLPTLLLAAGGLCIPRGARPRLPRALARVGLGLLPAAVAVVALLPAPDPQPTYGYVALPGGLLSARPGPPYPWPWIGPSQTLVAALGVALAYSLVITWERARTRPVAALASGLVLVSVAYPVAWVATRELGVWWWAYDARVVALSAALPLLLALTVMRRGAGAAAGP